MTSCSAWMAPVAMALTRAWSTVPPARSFCAKRSVAERPDPAADGLISVDAVMAFSCVGADGSCAVRPGSAVPAVARELVRVDLDTDPRPQTDDELSAGDLQRLGEQVVAHIEEVRELAGPPRRAAVGGTEGDG